MKNTEIINSFDNNEKVQSSCDFENMSDIQLIKTILSYMCSKKEYERAVVELEDYIDVSDLISVDALCLAFGSYSKNSAAFLKAMKKLLLFKSKGRKKKLESEDVLGKAFHKELEAESSECFCVAFINDSGKAVCLKKYKSDKNESINIDIKDISKIASRLKVSKVAFAHNHPSGSLVCSSMDYFFIKDFCFYMKSLKISFDSHYVVSPCGYSKTDISKLCAAIFDEGSSRSECKGESKDKYEKR